MYAFISGSCINNQVFARCGVLLIFRSEFSQTTEQCWKMSWSQKRAGYTQKTHTNTPQLTAAWPPETVLQYQRSRAASGQKHTHRVEVHYACWLKLAAHVWSSHWVRETLTDSSCWNDLIPTGSKIAQDLMTHPGYAFSLTTPITPHG